MNLQSKADVAFCMEGWASSSSTRSNVNGHRSVGEKPLGFAHDLPASLAGHHSPK